MLTVCLGLFLALLQTQDLPFQRFDTRNGLSNNIVYDVFQDSKGFIWIATENGLNKFDGYTFKTFIHDYQNDQSISNSTVRTITEDKEGNIWVGTYNGLNRYNEEEGTFKRFFSDWKDPENRLDIQTIVADEKGLFWMMKGSGFLAFNPQTEEAIEYPGGEGIQFQLFKDQNGSFWTKSMEEGNEFMLHFEEGEMKKYKIDSKPDGIYTIHFGKYSRSVWFNGNIRGTSFENRRRLPSLPDGAAATYLLEDADLNLWIASEEGLYLYNKNNELKTVKFETKETSFNKRILNLFEDRSGGIWIATINGLYYYDKKKKPFRHLVPSVLSGREVELPVMSFAELNGTIFIGTLGEGLKMYNSQKKFVQPVVFSSATQKKLTNVWSLYAPDVTPQRVWIGSDNGIWIYNVFTGKIEKAPLTGKETWEEGTVFSIIKADERSVWIASEKSVVRMDVNHGKILEIIHFDKPMFSTVQSLYQDESDKLWIGTEGAGIWWYDPETKTLKNPDNIKNPLFDKTVWDIFATEENYVWLGTGNGLYVMNKNTLEFRKIENEELSVRIVFSIERDENRHLWLGTDKGLMNYDPVSEDIQRYDEQDVVRNGEFNRRAVLKRENGELWFGGMSGATHFVSSEIKKNKEIPPVYITSARLLDNDGEQELTRLRGKEINLRWDHNTIEFSFVALNYSNPHKNRYQYKLLGIDEHWVHSGDIRLARYAKIPPGNYVFKVQAANNDGIWNTKGASLAFSIAPPFWKSSLFIALIVVLIVIALVAAYQMRISQIIKIERIRLRIASDLHDEIGSGLSAIALTGDVLQKQIAQGKKGTDLLKRMTLNARDIATSLDTIVWLIDPQKETLQDLMNRCKMDAGELLNGTLFLAEEHLPEKKKGYVLSSFLRRNLYLIIKEALNNIAKHAESTQVELSFEMVSDILNIRISDNGRGINKSVEHAGYGLAGMERRAREIGGIFEIESEANQGTTIFITIKLP